MLARSRHVRLTAAVLIASLAASASAPARADDDAPAAAPMSAVADDAAVCAALRAGWSEDAASSSCTRVASRAVAGVGVVDAWQAARAGEQRWALAIDRGREIALSVAIPLPASDCGAGHCDDVDVTPTLHALRPAHGRAAVALELAITVRWSNNETGATYRTTTSTTFVACGGPAAGGAWRCATLEAPAGAVRCLPSLTGAAAVALTCRWRATIDLASPP